MRVTEIKPRNQAESVSWTGKGVSYYLHVVDRTRVSDRSVFLDSVIFTKISQFLNLSIYFTCFFLVGKVLLHPEQEKGI